MRESWRGYVVAIAAMLVQTCVFGVMNSFTVFMSNMSKDPSLGSPSQTDISFGNGISLGLAPIVGFFAGRLVDNVDSRILIGLAAAFQVAGLLLSSWFAHSVLQITLLFSVPMSISIGFMLSPGSVAALSWFDKHASLASGIVFAGGGIGSCFVPAVASVLNDAYDWRKSFRLLALFGVLCAALAALVKMNRGKELSADDIRESPDRDAANDEGNNLIDPRADLPISTLLRQRVLTPRETIPALFCRDFQVLFWSFGCFAWAFYGILYLIVPYASSMGKEGTVYAAEDRITTTSASTLFTPFGIVQVIGSLLTGFFAVKINEKMCFVLSAGVGALLMAALALCRSYTSFAIVLGLLGFPSAGAFAVFPPLVAKTFPGPNVGLLIGAVLASCSIGGFTAATVISAMQTSADHDYTMPVALAGVLWALGGLILQFGHRD